MHDAGRVDFQDFNKEVLDLVTAPNVALHLSGAANDEQEDFFDIELDGREFREHMTSKRIQFWYGDWSGLAECIHQREGSEFQYDVILGSEVFYDPSSYAVLGRVLEQLLSPNGVAYIAGKTFYFGVGGSMQEFCAHLQNVRRDGMHLECMTCCSSQGAMGVVREVVEIRWVPDASR